MPDQFMVVTLRLPYPLYRELQILALDRRTKPSHLFAEMFHVSKAALAPADPRASSSDDLAADEPAK